MDSALLVGRADELAAINDVVSAGTHVLAVTGDPGIGKTRLLTELTAAAQAQGLPVIGGNATEFEQHLPFGALTESLTGWVSAGGRTAARFAPLVRDLLGSLPAATDDQYGSHHKTRALLEELAAPAGLAVVLDDLHWADSALVGLIGYLIHRPPRGRWVLALGYRSRQVDSRLEEAVCSGHVRRLQLAPLSLTESQRLLGVGRSAAERLHRDSGGNPLFLKALHRAGTRPASLAPPDADDLPPPVHAALLSELRTLPATTRAVADAASVAGDPFQYGLVAAIADIAESEATLLLDELVKRDLIRQVDPAPRFSFRHPLVRRLIYTGMAPSARRAAHCRAATALATTGATILARAHHVARSASAGDRAAAALLAEAARETLFQAPDTAVWLLTESLRLLPAGQHRRTLELARALMLTGRLREGRDTAHTLLGRLPDSEAAMRAEAAIVTAAADRLLGHYAQARAVLRAELERLDDDTRPAAVALMMEQVSSGLLAGDFDPSRRDILAAVAAAQRSGDRALLATAAAVLAFASYATGRYPEAVAQLETATWLVDALSPEELAGRVDALVWLAWTELFCERNAVAITRFDRALRLMRQAGQGHLLTYAMVGKAQAHVQAGQLKAGMEWAGNAVEAAELSGSDGLCTMANTIVCFAALYTGDLETAICAGSRAVTAARPVTTWWSATAGILLAQSRLAAGADAAQCLRDMLSAGGGPELSHVDLGNRPFCYQALAQAELALGHPAAALSYVDRADGVVARLGGAARARAGTATLLRAEVLLGAGEPAAAQTYAQRAVEEFSVLDKPFFLGRAHLALGRTLAAGGQRAASLAELTTAQTIFTEIGADQLAAGSVQAQRQLGKRAVRGPASVGALTTREAEVAALVAKGHTNRMIAAQLSLSERTVETHIRHICTRLDVSSRTAIAVAFTRASIAE